MPIQKNDEIEISVTGTTHDGSGVGRIEGMVVFIPGCAQGDRVRVKIIGMKKSMAYGKLLEVLEPSAHRIAVDCPVFSRCGGCVFRHISYAEELRIKSERVSDALRKIAHLENSPEEILGASESEIDAYRNKAQYPVGLDPMGNPQIGFYAPHSHRIVDYGCCALQAPVFSDALAVFREWICKYKIPVYDETTREGILRHIYLRRAPSTGEMMACAVINAEELPFAQALVDGLIRNVPGVVGVLVNINRAATNVILGPECRTLWGRDRIVDVLCGVRFEISPLSFYQVNSSQAARLYALAADYATPAPGDTLLDLYCGAGTIGLTMASRVRRVIGVEIVPQAVEDAKRNAKLNNIENADFFCMDAQQATADFARQGLRPDIILVDPPRKGCSVDTLQAIVTMAPEKVVYVSCDPATLARDLAILSQSGYRCGKIRPVDLFPRTPHVECCCLLERSIKPANIKSSG